ncbi:hypothetical protein [Bordetella genomosp. 9]|uniref:Uncharacterized protein n=1 Tax=Bordetella genomosp. 9 TaxID=1416803 RepID=A0A1W6Z402_9BORD|nr:hypothetical protein [Bordetella genomosp. 9]ARP88135.1 hypothetical protein CAL13_19385 [Bordetella genomosp. 9]
MNTHLSPQETYLARPIGEQMAAHLARRAEVRRMVPLLPRSLAELFAAWRRPATNASARPPRENRAAHSWASETK